MEQLVLANAPIEERIIDPDVHGLLYGFWGVVHLPAHYGEVAHFDMMTCDVSRVIDERRGPKVFLEPFPKGPCRFPYALLITIQLVTLLPIDYSAFLYDVAPILGGHQEVELTACVYINSTGKYGPSPKLGAKPFGTMCHSAHLMVPSVVSIIFVSITFSSDLTKQYCLPWWKLLWSCKIFCFT